MSSSHPQDRQAYSPGPTPGPEIPGAFPPSVEPTPVNEKPFEAQKSQVPPQVGYFPPKSEDAHTPVTAAETPSQYATSNQLRPGMPSDDNSTASIKSGVVGREPKTRFVDIDIPSPSLGGAVEAVQPKTPDAGLGRDTATYTVRSFPLKGRSDEQPEKPDLVPSSFDGQSMANHEERSHEKLHSKPATSDEEPHKEHHYGRDAALGGAGAAAAYGVLHDRKADSGPAPHTVGPHKSDAANVLDPTVLPQPEKQKSNLVKHPETGPATHTVGPHDNNLANIADPKVLPQPEKQLGHNVKHPETGPATKTLGPHKSNLANVLDPRVLPDPDNMKNHGWRDEQTGPAPHTIGPHHSDLANIVDPRVVPDPSKQKEHKTSGPHQSDMLNRMDPRAEAGQAPAANHNYGRDASMAGAGALAGAGVAAATKRHTDMNEFAGSPDAPRKPIQTGYDEQRAEPTAATQIGRPVDPETLLHSENQRHSGRDGAAASTLPIAGHAGHSTQSSYTEKHGDQAKPAPAVQSEKELRSHDVHNVAVGAGATSAAAAAYEFHKREAEKAEVEMHEKTQRSQKEHDKVMRDEKHHEKKGGLFGFLHHKDKDRDVDPKEDRRHHQGEKAVAGAGVAGSGVHAHDHDKQNRHKMEPSSPTPSTGSTGKESPSRRRNSVLGIFHRKDKSRRSSEEVVPEGKKLDDNVHKDTQAADRMTGGNESVKDGRNRLHKTSPRNYGKELQQQAGNHYGAQRYNNGGGHFGADSARERDVRDAMNQEYGEGDLTQPHKTTEGYNSNDSNLTGTGYHGGMGQNVSFEQARRGNMSF